MRNFLYNKSDIIVVLIIILVAGTIIYNRSEALLFPKEIKTTGDNNSNQMLTLTDESINQQAEQDKIKEPVDTYSNDDSITVSLTINSGDDSFDICKRLESLGVIETASEFYNYLIKNKYDTKLRDGTYTLTKNMEFEAIVDKLIY